MADIYEARIEVLTEENENIRRMLRRLKDTLLYKEKEVESLRGLLKECLRYIDIWGYTDSHENLLYPQIKVALGESEEK